MAEGRVSEPHDGGAGEAGRGSPYWRRYFEAAAHESDDHARVGYTNARYSGLMHETLRRVLGPLAGRRILDAGSGDGQVLGPVAGEARIVAMDFTAAMSARAARRGLAAVRADVTCPPFRPQSFDDVLCAEVLTQVDRPAEAAAGLAALVRPGGRIVLSGLNQRSVLRHVVRTLGRLRGVVEEVSFLGSVVRIRVRFKENTVSLDTFNNSSAPPPERGQPVTVSFARDDVLVLEGAEAA